MKTKYIILGIILVVIILLIIALLVSKANKELKEDEFFFESIEWASAECPSEQTARANVDAYLPNLNAKLDQNNIDALHCLFIIDSVDQFTEKGSYFNIAKEDFETWLELDPKIDHEIVFCCGAGEFTEYNENTKKGFSFYQVCRTKNLKALC